MTNITLKQLRYFEALARHGHFGRAADTCAISQPALSVQIKDMETELGAPLFERAARHVRLTSIGEDLAGHVRQILQSVDDLADVARAAQDGTMARLRLGVIPTIAPYLLPKLIGQLTRAYPDLDVHLRETMTARLVEELFEGRIDAAIVALPIGDPGLTELPLFDESLVLVRPATDAAIPVPSRAELTQMRMLLLEEGHCFRDQALSFCNMPSAMPRDGLDGSALSTLVQMVGAGLGVTLIPEMAVSVETGAAAVCVAKLDGPQPQRTVGIVWRKTNPLRAQLQEIRHIARTTAGHARNE